MSMSWKRFYFDVNNTSRCVKVVTARSVIIKHSMTAFCITQFLLSFATVARSVDDVDCTENTEELTMCDTHLARTQHRRASWLEWPSHVSRRAPDWRLDAESTWTRDRKWSSTPSSWSSCWLDNLYALTDSSVQQRCIRSGRDTSTTSWCDCCVHATDTRTTPNSQFTTTRS